MLPCLNLSGEVPVDRDCVGRTYFAPPRWAVNMGTSSTTTVNDNDNDNNTQHVTQHREGVAMHVVKDGEVVDTLKLDGDDSGRFCVFGRCPPATTNTTSTARGKHFTLLHPSVSRSHCALLRSAEGTLYALDLGSSHGTFLNNARLVPFVARPLGNRSQLRFGLSTRVYLVRVFPKSCSSLSSSLTPRTAAAATSATATAEVDEAQVNTVRNGMVGWYNKPTPVSQPPQQQQPKMERRVSFSCVAPEVIEFLACHSPAPPPPPPPARYGDEEDDDEDDEDCGGASTPLAGDEGCENGEGGAASYFASPPESARRMPRPPPPSTAGRGMLMLGPGTPSGSTTCGAQEHEDHHHHHRHATPSSASAAAVSSSDSSSASSSSSSPHHFNKRCRHELV